MKTQSINDPLSQTTSQYVPGRHHVTQQTTGHEHIPKLFNSVGIVTFKPIEVKFEKDNELIEKSNPYCKFKIGFHTGISSFVSGEGFKKWENPAELKVKGSSQFVKVKLKNFNVFTYNSESGIGQIPLDTLIANELSHQWIPIYKDNELIAHVLIEMLFKPKIV